MGNQCYHCCSNEDEAKPNSFQLDSNFVILEWDQIESLIRVQALVRGHIARKNMAKLIAHQQGMEVDDPDTFDVKDNNQTKMPNQNSNISKCFQF